MGDNMQKYGTEIKISVILLSIPAIIGVVIFFFVTNNSQTSKESYFLFENGIVWLFQGEQIEDLTDLKTKNETLANTEFSVYINNRFQRTAYLREKNTDWYYQDDLEERIPSPMFAYTGENLEVVTFNVNKLEQEDISVLNKYTIQKNYTIAGIEDLTYNEKVSFDFDSDGMKETLYVASNLYSHFENPEPGDKTFLIILYYDGNDSRVLKNIYIDKEDEFDDDMTAFEISSIIRLPNQEKYSIIFNRYKTMGGLSICPTLFEFKSDTFEMIKTCKEMES